MIKAPSFRSGFTIVELLIVIVVIGVLAAITIVGYNGIQQRARDSQRDADIASVVKALELYYIDNGQFPVIAPNGSTTGMGNYWSVTTDGSWAALASALVPKYLTKLPEEPVMQTNADPRFGTALGYAYYANTSSYCGKTALQMYILVYKHETGSQKNVYSGDCSSNVLNYAAASNYRVTK